jgi:chaperonin GroEL
VIRVGGVTEVDLKEMKDLADDATQATRAAVQGGIIPGGGVALLSAAPYLQGKIDACKEECNVCSDTIFGMESVLRSLETSTRNIANNAGKDSGVVVNNIRAHHKAPADTMDVYGYDAQEDVYGDMMERGIIDPFIVLKTALQNACAIAGSVLSTEVMIADRPKDSSAPSAAPNVGGMGGMGDMGF